MITCAEGDFHSLAAQMFGELLREHGVGVTVLGASTPADVVAEFLVRSGADSLAISCSIPIFFPGTVRLIDAAHRQGIPVIVGGRAFGNSPSRAERLGADAWALTAADATAILLALEVRATFDQPRADTGRPGGTSSHRSRPTRWAVPRSTASPPASRRWPITTNARWPARREDLVFIVRFLAATLLTADQAIFSDFLDWLQNLLVDRGVPPQALIAGLEALRPVVEAVDTGAALLLDLGRQELLDGPPPEPQLGPQYPSFG